MHQESMKSLMLHSLWDEETKKSIGNNSLPKGTKRFRDTVPIYELKLNGSTLEYSPFREDIDRLVSKTTGVLRVYKLNQISGVKVLVETIDKRAKSGVTFKMMVERAKRRAA